MRHYSVYICDLNSIHVVYYGMGSSEGTKTAQTREYRSKSARLVERIMADIDSGEYAVGSWLPPETVLCAKYGAARLTIRRTVDRLAQQGLLERVPHRGVLVRAASSPQHEGARAGERPAGRGLAIACILSASPDEGLVLIKEGVTDYAREAGLSLQVLAPADAKADPLEALADPERLGVSGLIVLPYPGAERRELLESLRRRHFPTVCVERRSSDVHLPSVEPDNAAGMYRAVNYLISRHRRPVYFLGMRCDHLTDAERYDGYVRAMKDAGFGEDVESHTFLHKLGSSDPGYWREERKWFHGFETARRLLKSVKTPLSVACVKDYTAWDSIARPKSGSSRSARTSR